MAKYSVAGKPYRTKIDDYRGASCPKCGKKILQHHKAIGVRHGLSFMYYHVTCYPKSHDAKEWKAKQK